LCQALITQRLFQSGKNKPTDIPIKLTFLSRLANFMFSQCQTSLSRQDLTAIRQQYFRDPDVEIDSNITEDLAKDI